MFTTLYFLKTSLSPLRGAMHLLVSICTVRTVELRMFGDMLFILAKSFHVS